MLVRLLFLIFAIMLPAGAQADFSYCSATLKSTQGPIADALRELHEVNREEWRLGVPDHAQTKYLLHAKNGHFARTDMSVVIYHGLFNNPSYTKALAEYVFSLGFNVINVRLAGHTEGDRRSLDRVSYKEWFAQVPRDRGIAEKLGDKVAYIGHSTGGLIALLAALKGRETAGGLVLLAASLEMRPAVSRLSNLDKRFSIASAIC